MKKLMLTLWSVLIVASIFAQPNRSGSKSFPSDGSLLGKISDSETGKPVEYASIALYREKDSSLVSGTVTDHSGLFKMENLPYGKYYMAIDFIGYEKKVLPKLSVSPQSKDVYLGNIGLKQSALKLNEVEVAAERTHIEYKLDKKVINVSQDLTSTGATAVEVLENTPSVQTDIDGNVSLRGSSNFQVLIDGKPSVLDGNDVLQQIPASTIERIEIITNPSAKYDPDGVGGIINVILKKSKIGGLSGLVNASYGSFDNYSFDALLNYRTEKISFFIGGETSYHGNPGTSHLDRSSYLNDSVFHLISDGERERAGDGYLLKAGFDYDINILNSLSFSSEYGLRGHVHSSESKYHEYWDPFVTDLYYINDNNNDINNDYLTVDMFYKRKFEKQDQELTANVIYSNNIGHDEETLDQYNTDEYWNSLNQPWMRQRSFEDENSDNLRIKSDYTSPIGKKSKLEAGWQSQFNIKEGEYRLENYDNDQEIWVEDNGLYNNIDFKRNIHAVYSTFSSKYAGFEYMLGIRGEYTDRLITSNILDEAYKIDRFDYFPSIHISRPIAKTQQIMASYGRRMQRPREWFLDPFPNYIDQYNIRLGNPELEPEYINSYELSYQVRIKKTSFIAVETYYRETVNKLQRITTLDDDNIMYHTFDNLNRDYALGVELMGNSYLAKWWTLNVTFDLFKYKIEGEILDDEVNQVTNTWTSRFNNTFNLKTGTRLQISGFYTAPSITAQGDRGAFFTVNTAVKQEFLKKKLSATFQVRDVFKTMKHSFTSKGVNFYNEFEFARSSPTYSLSLSYKINNYKKRNDHNVDMDFDEGDGEGM